MSALRARKIKPDSLRRCAALVHFLIWAALAGLLGCVAWGQAGASGSAAEACATADQALALSEWETARSEYTLCLDAEPSRFEILSNLAMALTHLGRMDEAIQTYQKALALSSGNPKVRFNLALVYIKVNNFGAATAQLVRLKASGLTDPRVPELLAFSYYHLGRYALAAREAEQVHRSHPHDAANALILGSAYTRMGLYQKALPLITFALQSAGSADGHLIMGQTLLGLRLYHPAMDELTQAAALQPDLRGLHTALGMAKVGLGDSDSAEIEFTKALKSDPDDFQANYYMGRLKRLGGDPESAQQYLDKAEQLHPGASQVLFELAAIAMTDHDYAKAEPMLKSVLRKEPDHIEAHFLLSELYRRTKRPEAARRERAAFQKLRDTQEEKQETRGSKDSSSSNLAPAARVPSKP